ncbi:hypothetical protein KHQ81_15465 (plasmid) [Mycoplasmatota bacterium]|nr:hypothetical protein KHQ81_15465 [Mycoplasmatota bacterium]
MFNMLNGFLFKITFFLTTTTKENDYIDNSNEALNDLQDKLGGFVHVLEEVLTWVGLAIGFVLFLFNFIKYLLAGDNAHQKEQAKANLKLPIFVMAGILTARLIWEAVKYYFI